MCFAQNVYESFEVFFYIFTGFVFPQLEEGSHEKCSRVVNLINNGLDDSATTSTNRWGFHFLVSWKN
jgi:hypothetical protein